MREGEHVGGASPDLTLNTRFSFAEDLSEHSISPSNEHSAISNRKIPGGKE